MSVKIELCGTYPLRQLKTEGKSSEEVMYRERGVSCQLKYDYNYGTYILK